MARSACFLFAAGALLVSVACETAATAANGRVGSIELTPASVALIPGAARAIDVRVIDASGSIMTGAQVHWAVENPSIATVTAQGVVTALAAGRTQVAASKGGVSGVAAVTVSTLPPVLVRVMPTTSTVNVGATATLLAEVRDAGGRIMPNQSVSWSSDRANVATVSSGGVVKGVSVGTAVITAAAAGLSGTAVVTVQRAPVAQLVVAPTTGSVKVGKSMLLAATARDAAGNVLTGRPLTWSSASATTATVLPTGLVAGVRRGTTTITATSEGKSASASITVR